MNMKTQTGIDHPWPADAGEGQRRLDGVIDVTDFGLIDYSIQAQGPQL